MDLLNQNSRPRLSRITTLPIFRALLALSLAAFVAGSAAAQTRQGGGGFGTGTRPPAQADEAFLFHVLNRVTFGANEESLAEIRTLGVDAYLWRQLHPETIDDSALEQSLAATLPPHDDIFYQQYQHRHEYLRRAASSKRQLEAVMTQFWENHFDTVVPYGNNDAERHLWTKMEEREGAALRTNALGSFRTLLEISAKSQAMMYFLDNYRNNVASGNENYARELLELHSLGVDCGYTQADVQEVARIWTGWSGYDLVRDPNDPSVILEDVDMDGVPEFAFNQAAHDFTAKTTLGQTFPAGQGIAEGERVLDIVTKHPCTARFLGRKLIEVFITDNPSDALVDHVAKVFQQTGGDIREVLWAIFQSPEFRDPAVFQGKVRTPMEYTLAAIRGTEGTLQLGARLMNNDYLETYYWIYAQGMQLFDFAIPTGYAERAPAWMTANGFLQRWKYSDALMNWYPDPNRPTYTDPLATVTRLGLTTTDAVMDHFGRMLLGKPVDADRRDNLRMILTGSPTGTFNPASGGQNARLREMVEQILGMPEFQKQ